MVEEQKSQHRLKYRGFLRGHGGWVTSLAVREEDEDKEWGLPKKMMTGHSHFISEIKLTQDSRFAFSASWDGSVRLWNVANGRTISKLIGHKRDVLSVALSADDRQIITGSLDKDIKIWNTRSECKFTVDKNQHTDAVSVVRFYHARKPALCVTASWDKTIKVWDNLYMTLLHTFTGHKAQVTTLDIVENSAFLASGSRDGKIMVWDIVQGKWFTQHECDSPVNCVLFSQRLLSCTSLAWSKSGTHLYSGWSDNHIRVYEIDSADGAVREDDCATTRLSV